MMPVSEIELFVFLLLAVAVLAGLGLRSGVPYPVALVLGGLVIGLMPGLPSPELDPDIVFFVFLPPLLYAAAIAVSAHELRANWAPITLLAVGLVLVTICAVAAVANAVLGVPWAAAFVLGAVLGPTDPVSAAAVLDRLGVTGRSKTILEGESLVNDGTALTAYKIAIAAVGGSAGSVAGVGAQFVAVAAGGIAIGLAAGWVFAHLRRLVTDPSRSSRPSSRTSPPSRSARRACSRRSRPASTSAPARSTSSNPARACARSRSGSRPGSCSTACCSC